jgi:hypothetical protein
MSWPVFDMASSDRTDSDNTSAARREIQLGLVVPEKSLLLT